jgi:hypothetical protein
VFAPQPKTVPPFSASAKLVPTAMSLIPDPQHGGMSAWYSRFIPQVINVPFWSKPSTNDAPTAPFFISNGIGVGVCVLVGVLLFVTVLVLFATGVVVGIFVVVAVLARVLIAVRVAVLVARPVAVGSDVLVASAVAVGTGVFVGIAVGTGVFVGIAVGTGVLDGAMKCPTQVPPLLSVFVPFGQVVLPHRLPLTVAPVRFAPKKFVFLRSAHVMIALLRSALVKFADAKSVQLKSVPISVALVKFTLFAAT